MILFVNSPYGAIYPAHDNDSASWLSRSLERIGASFITRTQPAGWDGVGSAITPTTHSRHRTQLEIDLPFGGSFKVRHSTVDATVVNGAFQLSSLACEVNTRERQLNHRLWLGPLLPRRLRTPRRRQTSAASQSSFTKQPATLAGGALPSRALR